MIFMSFLNAMVEVHAGCLKKNTHVSSIVCTRIFACSTIIISVSARIQQKEKKHGCSVFPRYLIYSGPQVRESKFSEEK